MNCNFAEILSKLFQNSHKQFFCFFSLLARWFFKLLFQFSHDNLWFYWKLLFIYFGLFNFFSDFCTIDHLNGSRNRKTTFLVERKTSTEDCLRVSLASCASSNFFSIFSFFLRSLLPFDHVCRWIISEIHENKPRPLQTPKWIVQKTLVNCGEIWFGIRICCLVII